jgi:hypothetical protein
VFDAAQHRLEFRRLLLLALEAAIQLEDARVENAEQEPRSDPMR